MVSDGKITQTENRILEAARRVFSEKGFDGARMQEIADEAGINKSLVHYYFRSKERLFQSVFESSLHEILEPLMILFGSGKPLLEVLPEFFRLHGDFLLKNPSMPKFILGETGKARLIVMQGFLQFKESGLFKRFEEEVNSLIISGKIKKIDPFVLLVNMLSLSVFPFVGGPILMQFAGMTEKEYTDFLQRRMDDLGTFIINAIT